MASDGASIGSVWVDVLPRYTGSTQAKAIGERIGKQIADSIAAKVGSGIGDGIEQGSRQAAPKATKAGSESGDAFGRGFKTRLNAILRDLPKARIDADSTDADRKVDELRQKIESLKNAKVGVDIDAATAKARIDDIRADLAELEDSHPSVEVQAAVARAVDSLDTVIAKADAVAAKSPTVTVDADTASADEKLAATEVEADAVGAQSPSIHVDADTAGADEKLAATGVEAETVGGLDPTINVNADTAGASAGLAAIGTEAEGASGSLFSLINVGILIGPVIVPAAAAAAAAIGSLGAVAFAVGGAIGVLALAVVPVVKAVTAMGAAQTAAGNAAGSAAGKQLRMAGAIDQVRTAQASLANTEANAADSQRRASEAVQNAVIAETDAQRQLVTAQQAVTQARIDAARAAQDLQSQIAHNALDQRQAALDTTKAQQNLAVAKTNAARAPSAANNTALAEAQLAYDRQIQQNKDLTVAAQRLAQDKAKSDKAGIDGSSQVVAAQQRVIAATEAVRKAEQGVIDARIAEATQARQNAFAVAQAQQGVVNAQRAVQQASISAGNEGSAAMGKLQSAMAKLTPAGQEFAKFLYGLKPIWDTLSGAAQNGLLPGLEAGIKAVLPVMPSFTKFVGAVASVLGDLFEQAGKALASPFWQDFFKQMSDTAIPILQQMGPIIFNVAKGFAGIFEAFAPLAPKIGGFLLDMSKKFADFGANLAKNPQFQKFLDYVTANGPHLVGLIGDIAVVVGKLMVAFAPLGQLILTGLFKLFDWLSKLSPGQLIGIAAGIGAVAAAISILAGGPVTLVIAGVVLIAGAFVYAYTHVKWFHDAVKAVFDWIVAHWGYLQEVIVGPIANAVITVVQHWGQIKAAAIDVWSWIKGNWPSLVGIIAGPIVGAAATVVQQWGAIKSGAVGVWNWIKTNWSALFGYLTEPVHSAASVISGVIDSIRSKFQTGIAAIGGILNGLVGYFKTPIRLSINAINSGLFGAYNWVADEFNLPLKHVGIPMPAGFASGGLVDGPGGPKDDAILARLSAGEFIIPAHIVQALGVDFFNRLIGNGGRQTAGMPGGDGSNGLILPGFADGGLVGSIFDTVGGFGNKVIGGIMNLGRSIVGGLKTAWNTVTDPIGWIRDHVKGLFKQFPTGLLTNVITAVGGKAVDGVLAYAKHFVTDAVSSSGNYVGPISAKVADVQAWIRAQAGKPYVLGAAGPGAFDCSGLVGSVYKAVHGQSPIGRIFSTMNEAPFFPKPAWAGPLTAGWANSGERGGGRIGHTAGSLAGLAFEATPPHVLVGKVNSTVGSFAHSGSFDSGGPLYPGLTIAYNGTGKTEYVLTNEQMGSIAAGRGGGGGVVYNLNGTPESLYQQVRAANDREQVMARIGRPH